MRGAPSITRSQFPIARGSVAQTRVEFATDFVESKGAVTYSTGANAYSLVAIRRPDAVMQSTHAA